MSSELARRERRAQGGIIQFAEEMQYIRDGKIYPNAGETRSGKLEPWKTYCEERWGMSKSTVDEHIKALPVLKRYSSRAVARELMPSVTAASRVATLAVPVQDKILSESPQRDDASDKAKAVRQVIRKAENEGREATIEEQIEAVETFKAAKPKRKPKMSASKFVSNLALALHHLEQAANIAHAEAIDDVENDYGWNRIERIKYELERLREKLYQPEIAKDADEEFAELLGGEK